MSLNRIILDDGGSIPLTATRAGMSDLTRMSKIRPRFNLANHRWKTLSSLFTQPASSGEFSPPPSCRFRPERKQKLGQIGTILNLDRKGLF